MNLFQKMSAITKEVAIVGKNLEVALPNGNGYKAVGEADVLRAVKPIEEKYGVYSYPAHREIVESGEIVTTTKYGERKSLHVRIETTYRFVNVEEPTEFIEITTYGDGVDSQDKAPGKAMTYADKYALLKAYKIQTGEDPDAEGSGDFISRELHKPMTSAQRGVDTQDKAKFITLARRAGFEPEDVLRQVGWKSGPMTTRHYADAIRWLDANTPREEK